MTKKLDALKKQLRNLGVEDLKALDEWLHTQIKQEQAEEEKIQRGYVEEYVKCGKPTCRCAKGEKLHGPYLYHYSRKNSKLVKRYVGKADKFTWQDGDIEWDCYMEAG